MKASHAFGAVALSGISVDVASHALRLGLGDGVILIKNVNHQMERLGGKPTRNVSRL